MELKEGYRYLASDEPVQAGDLWSHRGEFMNQWLPAKHLGEQLPYNVYSRKAEENRML